jgi:hypothetical protein
MKDPPLFNDAFQLCQWLLGRLGEDPRVLPRSLCETALSLLRAVTLALKGRRRPERIEAAEDLLIVLRTQLRLAGATLCLNEEQMLHALERADQIGRQLGGWRRAGGAQKPVVGSSCPVRNWVRMLFVCACCAAVLSTMNPGTCARRTGTGTSPRTGTGTTASAVCVRLPANLLSDRHQAGPVRALAVRNSPPARCSKLR